MKKVISILILLPLLGFSQLKKEVLFVGNSYTYVNDLPNLVKQIALSFGIRLYMIVVPLVELILMHIVQIHKHLTKLISNNGIM